MADEPSADPDTVPVRKFDWQRMVFRLEAAIEFKAIAWAYSLFANADGTNVRPGRDLIADGVDRSDRQTGDYLGELLRLGLLTVTRRGGGRGGAGTPTVYQLSMPTAGGLPMRLDPDLNRIAPRRAGRRPDKALEASAKKRGITHTDQNPASAQSDDDHAHDRNPASAQSDLDRWTDRNPASGENDGAPSIDRNPASGESPDTALTQENSASGQSPVDNSTDRNPWFLPDEERAGNHRNPASHENEFHRKPKVDSPEAGTALSGSLASDYQLTKVTKPLSVLSTGGDITTALDDDAPTSTSGSAEDPYDVARTIVAAVDPDDLSDLLSDARGELIFEGNPNPDHRQILMRAADIATRQPRSHP